MRIDACVASAFAALHFSADISHFRTRCYSGARLFANSCVISPTLQTSFTETAVTGGLMPARSCRYRRFIAGTILPSHLRIFITPFRRWWDVPFCFYRRPFLGHRYLGYQVRLHFRACSRWLFSFRHRRQTGDDLSPYSFAVLRYSVLFSHFVHARPVRSFSHTWRMHLFRHFSFCSDLTHWRTMPCDSARLTKLIVAILRDDQIFGWRATTLFGDLASASQIQFFVRHRAVHCILSTYFHLSCTAIPRISIFGIFIPGTAEATFYCVDSALPCAD